MNTADEKFCKPCCSFLEITYNKRGDNIMYCKLFDTNLSGYREDVTHDFDPIRCSECIAELEIKKEQ
jgi:hypothetical protein